MMNEIQYITVTNKVKISMMITILRDVLPDWDGVINTEGRKEMIKKLHEWDEDLYKRIDK